MKTITSSALSSFALCSLCFVFLASGVFAQTAPDAAELTKLLNDFLAGASRNDPAAHDRFWADDLIYTRSAGRRVTKADIMRDLRSAPAPKPSDPKMVFTAEDIQIQQYGNTAIVAFRLVSKTDTAGTKQVSNNLNSGTFVKRDGKWQVVSWQSTRMSRAEDEGKREVADVEAAFHQAIAAVDVNKLSAITDPNFIWTLNATPLTRKQFLDDLRAGRLKYVRPETAKSSVSVYGDTAVVYGEWPAPNAGRYTLTFIHQGGFWKAVAMHTSQ